MGYDAETAIRRADQVYFEFVCSRQTLDHGIAFTAQQFPDAPEHNAFREVVIQHGDALPAVWEQVGRHYADQGLRCRAWVPSAEQSLAVIELFLLEAGLTKRTFDALQVETWPELTIDDAVRVLPARAMRQTLHEMFGPEQAALVEAHMDYSQYDVSVAIVDGRAAGCGGLLQAGEIGMIRDLYVVPSARRRRIGSTLLNSLLQLARRLMMRIVVMRVDAADPTAMAFARQAGFVAGGELVEFHAPDVRNTAKAGTDRDAAAI